MRQNFDPWTENLHEWEGFKSNRSTDPGGETVYGISRRYHPEVEPWPPTWERAKAFYLDLWVAAGCDDLPFPLDVLHADSNVNPGPKGAREFLRQSSEHKDPNRRCVEYATLRIRYYLARIRENPVKLENLAGWTDRTLDFLERTVLTVWSLESQ